LKDGTGYDIVKKEYRRIKREEIVV